MSFLDSFLGGAAETGAGIISQNMKASQQQDLTRLESELAVERQKTLEAFKADQADKQRTAKSERIQSQLQKNAEADANANFQIPGEAPTTQADGKAMPQEGIDAFNEGKGILKAAMDKRKTDYAANPRNLLKAAVDTGDDDPSKLATIINDERRTASADAANAIATKKLELQDAENKSQATSREKRDQAALATAQAHLITANAALKKAEKSGDLAAINEAKTSVTAAFNGARGELSAMTDASKGAPRIEIVDGKPKGSPEDVESYNTLKKLVGVTSQSMLDKFSKKTAAPEADAPSGMKAVGKTPDGRTVYKNAKGETFAQ